MSEPKIKISCVANVYIKQMLFEKKGDEMEGHKHVFDHQSLLAKGSLKAFVNGEETYFAAPQIIFIKAEFNHKFIALEDNTVVYCIHALRDGDGAGDIIDPSTVPKGVKILDLAQSLLSK